MGTNDGLPAMLFPRPPLARGLGMPPSSHSSTGSKALLAARGWCSRPRLNTLPSMVVRVVWDAPADTHTTRSPPRLMVHVWGWEDREGRLPGEARGVRPSGSCWGGVEQQRSKGGGGGGGAAVVTSSWIQPGCEASL